MCRPFRGLARLVSIAPAFFTPARENRACRGPRFRPGLTHFAPFDFAQGRLYGARIICANPRFIRGKILFNLRLAVIDHRSPDDPISR